MHRFIALATACLLFAVFTDAALAAKRTGSAGSSHGAKSSQAGKTRSAASSGVHASSPKAGISHHSGSRKAVAADRDRNGKIVRSQKAKNDFRTSHPCPSTGKTRDACPGYVIDHKQALKRGGADAPANMQWQTQATAKAKDARE